VASEFGIAAKAFSSADQFLTSEWLGQTKCLILDIAMSGMPERSQFSANHSANVG